MWLLNVFKGNNMPVMNVPVAQLDRVLASDAKGRGFESPRVRHYKSPTDCAGLFASRGVEPRVRSIPTKSFVVLR